MRVGETSYCAQREIDDRERATRLRIAGERMGAIKPAKPAVFGGGAIGEIE